MNLETISAPWTHDELQLIGAELGDTITYTNENEDSKNGIIVFLTKTVIFVLTEEREILKFGRVCLTSADGKWDLVGLAEKEIRITKEEWQKAKNKIALMKKNKKAK